MKCKIKHDVKKRLQFSTDRYTFTKEKARGLEKLLLAEDFIESAVVNSITGSVVVIYASGYRKAVLSLIDSIELSKVEYCEKEEGNVDYWIKRKFQDSIFKQVATRFIVKRFLPSPFAYVNFIVKSKKYIKNGLASLKQRKLDVHVLDMTAIVGAALVRDVPSANSAMFYIGISELLEEFTEKRTKLDLGRSLVLNVEKVWKVIDGKEEKVSMDELKLGDIISIYEGNMVPVDGEVISGIAAVDEATMTGESEPAMKNPEATVYAGTVVVEGNIKVRVRALENETRLSRIVDLIYEGAGNKAKTVAMAEELADKIVPYSLGLALVTSLLSRSLSKGLSVLMVDYSCALRLTVPLAMMTAIREAVDNRVLIRGGKYIELFENANSIVFDKTGTLTEACPKVKGVVAMQGFSKKEVLRNVACIEEHFPHSMAKAIVKYADECGITHDEIHTEVKYVVAHGIVTTLNGEKAVVGSRHFLFEDEKIEFTEELKQSLEENQRGSSVVFFAMGGRPAGYIMLEDPPREEAKQVIDELKSADFNEIWMLTGDDRKNAENIAQQLGIENYMAHVLPENKAEKIDEIRKNSKDVIMVGDGINDSPALARASVSVAMRDASDLAKEVADIVIMDSDLRKLLYTRQLSRKTIKRVRQNYRNIVGFNSLLILLGIAGLSTATTNAFLHNLSTFVFGAWSTKSYFPERRKQNDIINEPEAENKELNVT